MNKRLRKKLRKGEFNWKGFEVTCRFDPPFSDAASLLDEFLTVIEANSLGAGGSFSSHGMAQFVIRMTPVRRRRRDGRSRFREEHCSEEDRQKIAEWLKGKPFVCDLVVGPLMGSWS